jgi:signal peptidase I
MKTEKMLYAFVGFGAVLIVLSTFSNVLGIFTALGGSMSPAINLGDMIITSGVNPADIKVSDVITFKDPQGKSVITHRVQEITPTGFVMKGDANNNVDTNEVKAEQIIGRVQFSVPFAGYLFHYAKSFYGFLVLVIIPGTIIIVGEVKKISAYRQGGSKGHALLLFFGSTILVTMLFSNIISTELYFSDTENVQKQFQAWMEWGPITNVTKWWSDTEFVPMSDPMYNNAFFVVYHDKTGKVTSTNPGGFFININVTLLPNTNSLTITDEIINHIKGAGDFATQGGRPIQLFLDGVDVTDQFELTFNGTLMTATLKTGQTIGPGNVLYLKMHLDYAITTLNDSELALYRFTYINQATAIIVSDTSTKTYHANEVSLIGELKCVDCDPPEVGGLSMAMGGGGGGGGTVPIIEEPVLNETIPDNSTIDVPTNETIEIPTNETVEVPTNETNATEPGLNETLPVTYRMEAGPNVFLVPDTWTTTAFQLAIDYPLILDVSYVDAESSTVTYVAGDPVENSFDIVAGMTIIINASEPFDMV